MTEQQRQEQYKEDCRQVAFDIFMNAGEKAAHNYLNHKFALLNLYILGKITLLEFNEVS